MVGHNEVRQQILRRGRSDRRSSSFQLHEFADDAVRPERPEQVQLAFLGRRSPTVGKVHDLAAALSLDRGVGR